MAKKIFGLASVKMGAVANDGGMGTSLVAVGETVSETAVMTQEDNTTNEFTIEESDSPVESIVSEVGAVTFAWSSYKVDAATLYKFFGGTVTPYIAVGGVKTTNSLVGGSAYTNGFYTDVPLTGGTGTGATANITIAGGAVTAVDMVNRGSGYTTSDELSASASNIGGTGTGFTIDAATVQTSSAQQELWEAPDAFPDVEVSLELTDKKGNVVKLPRNKISAKFNLSFNRTSLGQIDMVATVLQPTKVGEKRITIAFANPS